MLVVPVGERQDHLFVVEILVGVVNVVDDEGAAETVGVLVRDVSMVPVGTGLLNLRGLYQPVVYTRDKNVTKRTIKS